MADYNEMSAYNITFTNEKNKFIIKRRWTFTILVETDPRRNTSKEYNNFREGMFESTASSVY